jgi:hypothetical protein
MNSRLVAAHMCGLLIVLTLTQGCGTILANAVNKQFPPRDPTSSQLTAIAAANQSLDALPRAELYAGVASEDLNKHIGPALKQSIPGLKEVVFSLGLQDLRADVVYDGEITDPRLKASFRVRGQVHAFPSAQGSVLTITPALTNVKVERVRTSHLPSGAIKAALNLAISTFINNINGQLPQQKVVLIFPSLPKLSPETLFKDAPDYVEVQGDSIMFSPALKESSVLVDSGGIHALAHLIESSGPNATVTSIAGAPGSVETEFSKLKEKFATKARVVDSELVPDGVLWTKTVVAVNKPYVMELVNSGLGTFKICGRFRPPDQRGLPFASSVPLETAPDLQCGRIRDRSCSIQRECSQTRSCDPNWGCPDCGPFDFGCYARRAGCEADKVRYRAQCEAEKESARIGCEIGKETERLACEAAKAAAIVNCGQNQAWLNLVGGMEVARISGTADFLKISGSLCLSNFTLDENLEHVSVGGTLSASAEGHVSLLVQPLNLGYVACQAPFGGDVNVSLRAPAQGVELRGDLQLQPDQASSSLGFSYKIRSENPVRLRIEPPPIVAVLTQLPQAILVCAPGLIFTGVTATLSGKVREDLIRQDFDQKAPEFAGVFQIQPIHIELAGSDFIAVPQWSPESVRFISSGQ